MKKDKIIRKKIKSRKAKCIEKKTKEEKKKTRKRKNGEKVTWTWTSLNPPVSGRKTHPVARALRRGFERAFLAKLEPGLFPLSFPFLSPLSPFHGEDFPPASSRSGWHWSPEWNMNETNETNETRKKDEWNTKERRLKHERKTNETRKKGEWNKWNMNETRG